MWDPSILIINFLKFIIRDFFNGYDILKITCKITCKMNVDKYFTQYHELFSRYLRFFEFLIFTNYKKNIVWNCGNFFLEEFCQIFPIKQSTAQTFCSFVSAQFVIKL